MFYIDSDLIYLVSTSATCKSTDVILVSNPCNNTIYRELRFIEEKRKLPQKDFILKQDRSKRLCFNPTGDLFYSIDRFEQITPDRSFKLFAIKPKSENGHYVVGSHVYVKCTSITIAPNNFKVKIKAHAL
jgi:hypothetical protein